MMELARVDVDRGWKWKSRLLPVNQRRLLCSQFRGLTHVRSCPCQNKNLHSLNTSPSNPHSVMHSPLSKGPSSPLSEQ